MKVPILLLTYNRPEQTLEVLKQLQAYGATTVYVAADGPKNMTDKTQTDRVKSVINSFNPLVANTLFSETNKGCKNAVITAVNWFFDAVEEGIILEDDCLPSEHFFVFMNDMLSRYREAKNIWMISGNNPLGAWDVPGGHFFSRIGHTWGWATWRNRWQTFDPTLPQLSSFTAHSGFENAFGPTDLAAYRKQKTRLATNGEIDTWDYQWMAHILMKEGCAVVPVANLVKNIGFTHAATHLTHKPHWIKNQICETPIAIAPRKTTIDRTYEMELELCRRSNASANPSGAYFEALGKHAHTKLNVVLINTSDSGGGAEKMTSALHWELLKLGHTSTLLVQHKKSKHESVVTMQSNVVHQVLSFKPDVIHIHNIHGTSLCLQLVAQISVQVPILFTLHDTWFVSGSTSHPFVIQPDTLSFLSLLQWKKVFKQRQAFVASSNIRFTAPSQWLREKFFNAHGIIPHYVPNGIEKTPPESFSIPSNRYILFVANKAETNPYKDLATLKKTWTKANQVLGDSGVDLLCVSGIPKEEIIGGNRFILLPKLPHNQVLHLMSHALFVVQASKQDNAPLVILEAHLVKKMVVAARVGGIPEMLSVSERNLMFEPQNTKQLQQKLIAAIQSNTAFQPKTYPNIAEITTTYLGHFKSLISEKHRA